MNTGVDNEKLMTDPRGLFTDPGIRSGDKCDFSRQIWDRLCCEARCGRERLPEERISQTYCDWY